MDKILNITELTKNRYMKMNSKHKKDFQLHLLWGSCKLKPHSLYYTPVRRASSKTREPFSLSTLWSVVFSGTFEVMWSKDGDSGQLCLLLDCSTGLWIRNFILSPHPRAPFTSPLNFTCWIERPERIQRTLHSGG